MSEVERFSADAVASSQKRGFWVHAGDFNQKMSQAAQRESELRQQLADLSNERDMALRTQSAMTVRIASLEARLAQSAPVTDNEGEYQ